MLTKEAIKNGSSPVKRKRIMCPSRQSFGRYVWYCYPTATSFQTLWESPSSNLKVPPNWGQTKCIQSSKREKYFYFSWRPLFSPLDLTEHDWLPIESLFRFIVFAQRIACWWQAWKSCAFSLWFILGVGVVIYILNVCRIKLSIKGGKVRKT